MMKFFAYFRNLFAVDRAYELMASVVYDAINNIYIPELKKMVENVDIDDGEKIMELIDVYKKYGNPHSAEGREIAEVTARVVGSTASKYRNSGVSEEDVIQQITVDFVTLPRAIANLKKFVEDIKKGPRKLINYWSGILNQHAEYRFRGAYNQISIKHRVKMEDNTQDELANLSNKKETDFDEFIKEMPEYVHKNIKRVGGSPFAKEIALEVFDLWYGVVKNEDNLDYDLAEVRNEWEKKRKTEGKSFGRSNFYEGIKTLKDVLKKYFTEMKSFTKAASGKTASDRVANLEFRVRFAKWMLGE